MQDLNKHYKDQLAYHNQLIRKEHKELEYSVTLKTTEMEQQVKSLKSEIAHLQSELATKLQPLIDAVMRAETTIQQLQEGFGEMALMVQTLQVQKIIIMLAITLSSFLLSSTVEICLIISIGLTEQPSL